tara:strand:- start:40 stop:594 length:555 start_codon:yes stop_codon:yes gene_type:complete
MSTIEVNKITPAGAATEVTLGESGDTFTLPSGVTLTNNGTASGFGKIIGVQDNIISSDTNTTSGTYADVISTTYTPSATGNYLLVYVNITYRLHGLSSTTTPNGYVQVVSPTTTRATRHIQTKLPANSDNEKGFASFYAYWNPNTTSSVAVKLQFKEDAGGQFLLYGNSDYTRATSMTIFEVSA